jgi:hypothetical protein
MLQALLFPPVRVKANFAKMELENSLITVITVRRLHGIWFNTVQWQYERKSPLHPCPLTLKTCLILSATTGVGALNTDV